MARAARITDGDRLGWRAAQHFLWRGAPIGRKSGRTAPVRTFGSRGYPMAIDLVSLVSQFLTPQLVGSLARAVGINEAIAQRLAAAAIPTILASLATTAAAPGGAQRLVDAVSNSDPDLLTKLTGALTGGNTGALAEGANLLGGLLGGSGLSSIAGALSQYSGAPAA